MPKVISRAAISSSNDAAPTASAQAVLKTYYCLCGEFLLVIDKALDLLPRRPIDGSIVVRCKPSPPSSTSNPSNSSTPSPPRTFKLNSVDGGKVFVKREPNLLEPHHLLLCSRCTTPIGYQCTPPPVKSGRWLYLYWGGMTEIQGQVPEEAWEGEEEVNRESARGGEVMV
ncbi:hypothetical protein BDY24DRAFT_394682 [Mrakia frigida]|uniref:uncharacterized protein n=1 Tax=Mrakia frigida TaxID=29902 RepID=UPI003FCC08E1